MTEQEIVELNKMADSLYYVAGSITMLSRCESTAVKSGCECKACNALERVHQCMNKIEEMVKS